MLFNYRYRGNSAVSSNARETGMNFVPDALRQPTHFSGQLHQCVPFREAISALHDVVISDLRLQPKDKTAYKEWAKQQEDLWLAEALGEAPDVAARLNVVSAELQAMQKEWQAVMGPFYKAQISYFNYLYKHDKNMWWVLDPVITVHPDELFFECFSQDESTYGRLSCGYEVFSETNDFVCGTTNVDYSDTLYREFQKIRDYKKTRFAVDPAGFEVTTENEDDYREVKIDLPDSWVRGFLQVSSAMTLDGATFDLHPMDMHNICFILRRAREKCGPRSMRFILEPDQPVKILFEPWNRILTCPRSPYHGPASQEVRIWGRRRLLTMERLIPAAKKFSVTLLGYGMPSFYVADLGDMSFTLGLSGWTANDWSRMGNFDLMAPRAETDDATKLHVFQALQETWFEAPAALANRLGLQEKAVHGALASWIQAGRAIFDLNKSVYRVRELSREALPMDKLRFANEREGEARQFLNLGQAIVKAEQLGDMLVITGDITEKNHHFQPRLWVDQDERLVNAQCTCNFFSQNKLRMGPCAHILAARMAHNQQQSTHSTIALTT